MSTTFEVYPGTEEIPTFCQLLTYANGRLKDRLPKGTTVEAEINVMLRRCNGNAEIPHAIDSKMNWSEDIYAWFSVSEVIGGTDAYFETVDDLDREVWEDYAQDEDLTQHRATVNQSLSIGHYWSFRRSAGQPGIVNLAYGLLAGSLAELTRGFVFSDDSAWVWPLMPITGNEFLKRYLVPGGTDDPEAEEWTKECLEWIPGELAG